MTFVDTKLLNFLTFLDVILTPLENNNQTYGKYILYKYMAMQMQQMLFLGDKKDCSQLLERTVFGNF